MTESNNENPVFHYEHSCRTHGKRRYVRQFAELLNKSLLIVIFGMPGGVSQSYALTINGVFTGGDAPTTNVYGTGNIQDIFATAAAYWEAAILDTHTITIEYGWGPLTSNAGQATYYGRIPPTSASIVFDNDGTTQWYMDPEPTNADEYSSYADITVDNPVSGVESIIAGRRYGSPNQTDANMLDMLTLAMHEIGHAIGFGFSSYDPMLFDLVVEPPLPKAGIWVINNGTHILGVGDISTASWTSTPKALMAVDSNGYTQTFGERKLPSELDILAVAQHLGFTNVNLDPQLVNDADGDTIPDDEDNCSEVANIDQRDTDGDGYGNLCDGDLNNDGDTNTLDLNLYKLAHRTAEGDANYNVDADFNGDSLINTLDLNIYKGLHRLPPGPSCCGAL